MTMLQNLLLSLCAMLPSIGARPSGMLPLTPPSSPTVWRTVNDIAKALPPNSSDLMYYLCRTYGGDDARLASQASKWKWERVQIVWINKLPPLLATKVRAMRFPFWESSVRQGPMARLSANCSATTARAGRKARFLYRRAGWPAPAEALYVYAFNTICANAGWPGVCAGASCDLVAPATNRDVQNALMAADTLRPQSIPISEWETIVQSMLLSRTDLRSENGSPMCCGNQLSMLKDPNTRIAYFRPFVSDLGWVEVTHCPRHARVRQDLADAENTALWMYMAVGSGLWYHAGRTLTQPAYTIGNFKYNGTLYPDPLTRNWWNDTLMALFRAGLHQSMRNSCGKSYSCGKSNSCGAGGKYLSCLLAASGVRSQRLGTAWEGGTFQMASSQASAEGTCPRDASFSWGWKLNQNQKQNHFDSPKVDVHNQQCICGSPDPETRMMPCCPNNECGKEACDRFLLRPEDPPPTA